MFESHLRQLIFIRESDCLGCAVLLCLVCLFDLACFFLPSFSSLIKTCIYTIICTLVRIIIETLMICYFSLFFVVFLRRSSIYYTLQCPEPGVFTISISYKGEGSIGFCDKNSAYVEYARVLHMYLHTFMVFYSACLEQNKEWDSCIQLLRAISQYPLGYVYTLLL